MSRESTDPRPVAVEAETTSAATELEPATRTAIWASVVGLVVSLAIALVVILTAIDIQSARIPDSEGHGWSFGRLFGPDFGSGLNKQGWTVLTYPGELTPDAVQRFQDLLVAHVSVDAAFALVYTLLLIIVIRAVTPAGRWRAVALVAAAALLLTDLAENLLASVVTFGGTGLPALLAATTIKWVLVGVVAAVLVLSLVVPRSAGHHNSPRRKLRRAIKAVVHQRFSYLPVVAIFILSIPAGAAILEQLPDVQRRWVFDGATGARHAVAAMAATLLLAGYLLAVGRRRTLYALRHPARDSRVPAHAYAAGRDRPLPNPAAPTRRRAGLNMIKGNAYFGIWLIPPIAALLGVIVTLVFSDPELIRRTRLSIFVGVPLLLVVLGSAITRRAWKARPAWTRPDQPPEFDPDDACAVGIAGSVAGIAAIVVGGLSLLRAYTPLIILPATDYVPADVDPTGIRSRVILLVTIGCCAVIVPWLVMIMFSRRYGGPTRGATGWQRTRPGRALLTALRRVRLYAPVRVVWRNKSWVLLILVVAVFIAMGIFPRFAAWIGLSATATITLGALAGMVSAAGLVIQDRPVAEVFRLVGFRRTPLITLMVITVLLVSIAGGRSIHDVDRGATPALDAGDTRPTLTAAFENWYENAAQCEIQVGDYPVRPMLMIAAEGGGIRASYWTVRGLQAIADRTCGEYSTLFSGGASGGSVGLTVARFSGTAYDVGSREAVDAVKEMAESEILSRAADGTFVRDLLYGATGIPVPRAAETGGWDWRDRGRLIEDGWVASGGWGGQRYLGSSRALSPATGELILNSTSVKHNCRVWISQIQLGEPGGDLTESFDPEKDCDKNPGPGPRTIDLFRAYGPYVTDRAESCLGMISAATAALLTARFPYVTPSGTVGPCPDLEVRPGQQTKPYWPATQLVDGGYIENSGLATITDLSEQWLALVRENNRRAFDAAGPKPALVVPIIIYLANGDRDATQPALGASPTSELAVPPATFLRGGSALDGNAAQLARAQRAVALDGFCPIVPEQAVCTALDRHFPSRVVVIDRVTQPEIGAPLGWVLSGASITALDNAMIAQLQAKCDANQPMDVEAPLAPATDERQLCRTGFATLGDLERYFTYRPN